ncbi:MAG: hypothetical protein K0Q73_4014 [Paenibacillus sp.]|jgi:hypothetical protein|nr:hypothetical protein [Paenibacillus sp.]
MILVKPTAVSLIRMVAIGSLLAGALYLPVLFGTPLQAYGLGHESMSGHKLTELWAMWSLLAGIVILLMTFLIRPSSSILPIKVLMPLALSSMVAMIAAQLLPLFWWMYLTLAVFSWSNVTGLTLHIIMLAMAFWASLSSLHVMTNNK